MEMEFSIAHNLQEWKSHELINCDRRNVNFVKNDLLDVTFYPNDESLYRRRWQARRDICVWSSILLLISKTALALENNVIILRIQHYHLLFHRLNIHLFLNRNSMLEISPERVSNTSFYLPLFLLQTRTYPSSWYPNDESLIYLC